MGSNQTDGSYFNLGRTAIALLITLSSAKGFAKFEAHEWGTFTSLVGSDGITQHGMYHEDERLPGFVYGFGETRPHVPAPAIPVATPQPLPFPGGDDCRGKSCFSAKLLDSNKITQKMETPVIYFYSGREQQVEVNVKFPTGVITETFPAPTMTSPNRATIQNFKNGDTTFVVDVLNKKPGAIPYVDSQNIYGHARAVDSNIVRSGNDEEKFIFYRGLGTFQPRLSITSKGGALKFEAPGGSIPTAIFLVHVNNQGHARMLEVPSPAPNRQTSISQARMIHLMDHSAPIAYGVVKGETATNKLVNSLIANGLFADEAKAMIATWEHGYLKVPGLRVLYVLPRAEADELLPLRITPQPDRIERVFVGRIEVLLDTEEQRILELVREQKENFAVEQLGRFAEPMLRRVSEVFHQSHIDSGRKEPAVSIAFRKLIERASRLNEMSASSTAQ